MKLLCTTFLALLLPPLSSAHAAQWQPEDLSFGFRSLRVESNTGASTVFSATNGSTSIHSKHLDFQNRRLVD